MCDEIRRISYSNESVLGAEHVGEREGYSKDYTLYQRLTVQEK